YKVLIWHAQRGSRRCSRKNAVTGNVSDKGSEALMISATTRILPPHSKPRPAPRACQKTGSRRCVFISRQKGARGLESIIFRPAFLISYLLALTRLCGGEGFHGPASSRRIANSTRWLSPQRTRSHQPAGRSRSRGRRTPRRQRCAL